MSEAKTRDEIVAQVVADLKTDDKRLTDLVDFALAVSAAMVDVGAPENVPIPDFIRKEIRPDPVIVERVVKMVEALIRAGGGPRSTWAIVIESAIMNEVPAVDLMPPATRIIRPKGRLH